jgi:hypothetical protein
MTTAHVQQRDEGNGFRAQATGMARSDNLSDETPLKKARGAGKACTADCHRLLNSASSMDEIFSNSSSQKACDFMLSRYARE